jgi:hypothetical protein
MKNTDKELEKLIEEWCGRSDPNWGLIAITILTVMGTLLLLTCN